MHHWIFPKHKDKMYNKNMTYKICVAEYNVINGKLHGTGDRQFSESYIYCSVKQAKGLFFVLT